MASKTRPQAKRTTKAYERRRIRDPFAIAFGERLEKAAKAKGLTQYGLATAIGDRWGKSKPTTRIGQYLNGVKLPGAKALRDLSDVLGVSPEWLLFDEGPVWREGQRPATEWTADLSSHIQRQLHSRFLAVASEREGIDYGAYLRPEHIAVDSTAVLEQILKDAEVWLREDINGRLLAANNARIGAAQIEVIESLVKELPLGDREAQRAGRAILTMSLDAVVGSADLAGSPPIGLTDDGIESLLPQWEFPEATEAQHTLLNIVRRLAEKKANEMSR